MIQKSFVKLCLLATLFFFVSSCKKNDGTSDNSTGPVAGNCNASPYRVGTVATYKGTGTSTFSVSCSKDTTISGKKYIKIVTTGAGSQSGYIYVDPATGYVWQFVPAGNGDLPANEMIYVKPGATVGSTWNYTFPSALYPALISYKYTHTVVANNITFTLNGITYTNCIKTKIDLETVIGGTSSGATVSTATTWACGLGSIGSEQNGSVISTLTGYTY